MARRLLSWSERVICICVVGLCVNGLHQDANGGLLVDWRASPVLSIDSTSPRFSWAIPLTQANQSSYQLQVFTQPSNAVVWDTGNVSSSQQYVLYDGPALNASSSYSWRVQTSGPASQVGVGQSAVGAAVSGELADYSSNASFVTGVWSTWQARPVWHPNATAGFVYLRSDVSIPSSLQVGNDSNDGDIIPWSRAGVGIYTAVAFATANPQGSINGEVENSKLLAAYKLYVNGAFVGLGPGRPGRCGPVCPVGGDPGTCNCTHQHVYDAYDITDLVVGTSAVQAPTDGNASFTLALQCFNYPPSSKSYAINVTSMVLLQVVVTYYDGSQVVLGTGLGDSAVSTHVAGAPDASAPAAAAAAVIPTAWQAFNADPYFNPSCCVSDAAWYNQPSENFIGSLEQVGWRNPGFNTSSAWTDAATLPPFDPAMQPLVARPTLPMMIADPALQPALVQEIGPGHWFIDLGVEIQGGLTVSWGADAAEGTQYYIRMGEELLTQTPPSVMYDMRTGNKYENIWTLRAGNQTFEHHEYLEFRYAEIVAVNGTSAQCAKTESGDYVTPITLACQDVGATITAVNFSSWGTPSGACLFNGTAPQSNDFLVNASCNYDKSPNVVAGLCVGKKSCTFTPSDQLFGNTDPCDKVYKWLAVAVNCSSGSSNGGSALAASRVSVGPAAPISITAWVLRYPAQYVDNQVLTSDASLNDVWGMCQYTVVATALDMYTDSNTRQRSVICAEALHLNILMQFATSYEVFMQRYTLEYTINTRPTGLGWAEWQALTIFSVFEYYQYSGDLSLFAEQYQHLRWFTEQSLVNVTGDGLWTCDGTSFDCTKPEIDWPSGMRDGFVFVPADTVVNAYTYRAMLNFADMASDLGGHDADVTFFNDAAAAVRKAMNAQLYVANSSRCGTAECQYNGTACGCYVDGLTTTHTAWHSSVFSVAFGIPTPDTLASVVAYIQSRSIADQDLCMPSNVYPAHWALAGLYQFANDYGVSGLSLLTCNGTNSWMAMLRQGATTAMEAWNADEKPNLTWSHSWGASPAAIIIRWLFGIRPLSPGFERVLIQPQLGTLTHIVGAAPSIKGPILLEVNQTVTSSFVRGDRHNQLPSVVPATFSMSFSVPGNTQARVCLPTPACAAADSEGNGDGTAVMLDGQVVTGVLDGGFTCVDPVPSGLHTAVCPATATA